jgi:hypothetical protein
MKTDSGQMIGGRFEEGWLVGDGYLVGREKLVGGMAGRGMVVDRMAGGGWIFGRYRTDGGGQITDGERIVGYRGR